VDMDIKETRLKRLLGHEGRALIFALMIRG
jgi:hypothetical protein